MTRSKDRMIHRSYDSGARSREGEINISFGTNKSGEKKKKRRIIYKKPVKTRMDTTSTLLSSMQTTKNMIKGLAQSPVKPGEVKKESIYLPKFATKPASQKSSKVIHTKSMSRNKIRGVDETSELERQEQSIEIVNSEKRLANLRKIMLAKQTGFSRNLRVKLTSIAEMEVLKNRIKFKKEIQPDTRVPPRFRYYKFIKEEFHVLDYCKPETVAIQGVKLKEFEVERILNYLYHNKESIKVLILDGCLPEEHNLQFCKTLANTPLPNCRMVSLYGGQFPSSKFILKNLEKSNVDLEGHGKKLRFIAKDFYSRSLSELVDWENFFFKTHQLEVIHLDISNSYIFERILDESPAKFSSLRWLALRNSYFDLEKLVHMLKELRALEVLIFENVVKN